MPSAQARRYKALIAAWVERNGWICPGYRRLPHYSKDLTIDHRFPRARGGSERASNLRVLCRSCNSRKRSRKPDPPMGGPSFPHPLKRT